MCNFIILEVRSQKSRVLAGLPSFLKALEENPFPCSFQLLEARGHQHFLAHGSLLALSKPATLHLPVPFVRKCISLCFLFSVYVLCYSYWLHSIDLFSNSQILSCLLHFTIEPIQWVLQFMGSQGIRHDLATEQQ